MAFGFHLRVNFGIKGDVGRRVLDGPICAWFKTVRDSLKLLLNVTNVSLFPVDETILQLHYAAVAT